MTGVSNASITSILSASNLGQAKLPEDISGAITGTTEGIIESQGIRAFTEKQRDGVLAPMTAPAAGEWEKVRAIVDSGASVPAFHPSMGRPTSCRSPRRPGLALSTSAPTAARSRTWARSSWPS